MTFVHQMKRAVLVCSWVLLAVACGGGDVGTTPADASSVQARNGSADTIGGGDAGGGALAQLVVGDDRWEFDNVVCLAASGSLDVVASQGLIGVGTEPTVAVKVVGDWEGTTDGEVQSVEITMVEGALTDPDTAWVSTQAVGEASFNVDGSRFVSDGLFDDGLTTGTTEEVSGAFEAVCSEPIEAPPQTTTTLPNVDESGFVTVGGETFVFTYDPPGRCGADGGDGRISSAGVLVDDPTRQVVFTYATSDMSSNGEPALQLIVYGPDGQQQWYSAVGFFADGVGSIETMTGDATSVRVTGTLQRSGTTDLAPFEAEATCNQ